MTSDAEADYGWGDADECDCCGGNPDECECEWEASDDLEFCDVCRRKAYK